MTLQEIVKKDYIEGDTTLVFKTTPLYKIIVLSFLSFGFYLLILNYDYWKTLKKNFGYKVSPFWRTVFSGFTNFILFPVFSKYFKHYKTNTINAIALALTYFLCNGISSQIDKYSIALDTTNWGLEALNLFILGITIAIYVLIQNNINVINNTNFPTAPKNDWKRSNTIWTVILTIIFIVAYLPN